MRKRINIIMTAMLILTVIASVFAPSAFAAEAPELELNGVIELTDHPAAFSEEYTVTITAEDKANAMPEGSVDGVCEVSVAAGEFTLPAITFTERGVYEYTITQKAGSADRWTYDDSVYNVTVYVTNAENGDGMDITTAVYKNDETAKSDIVFTNVYDPAPVTVTITALKTLQDGELEAGEFTFELKDETGAVVQTTANDANGNVRFEGITFEATGEYVYQLSEVIGTRKEINYDTSVYTITITVTQNGDLVASADYQKNGGEYDKQELEFVNIEQIPPGDNTNIILWVALFAVSVAAVVVLAVIGKKRSK